MAGFLVPPWYQSERPNETELYVCSIIWGLSLACAIFTGTKATRQTWSCYRRGKLYNAYIIMIWAEWMASVIISVISWCFLSGIIPPSFWLFFAILCFWVIQMQCIVQIIINRISLIIRSKPRAQQLRWGVFAVITMINISVFCVWIPARLQISESYIYANEIWDRTEKAIFALVDAGLNLFFIITVRRELANVGLPKYRPLYRFNGAMMCLSVALDIILIGSMSVSSGIVYIQFHPLVYLVKLHIELNMADLISKIVRATNPPNSPNLCPSNPSSPTSSDGPYFSRLPSGPSQRQPSDPSTLRNPARYRDSCPAMPASLAGTFDDPETADLGLQYLGAMGTRLRRNSMDTEMGKLEVPGTGTS